MSPTAHRRLHTAASAAILVAALSLAGCGAPSGGGDDSTPAQSPGPEVTEDVAATADVEVLDTNVFDAVTDGDLIYYVGTDHLNAVDIDGRIESSEPGMESAEETELATYPGRNGQAVVGTDALHIVDLDTLYTFADSFEAPPIAVGYDVSETESVTSRSAFGIGDGIWTGGQATEALERATGRSVQLVEFAADGASVLRYIAVDLPSREASGGALARDGNDGVTGLVGDERTLYAALTKGVVRIDAATGETTHTFEVDAYETSQGRASQYGNRISNIVHTEDALGGDVIAITVVPNGADAADRVIALDPTTLEVVGDYALEYANGTPEYTRDGSLQEIDGELWAVTGVITGGIIRLAEPGQGDDVIEATAYLTSAVRDVDPISRSVAGAIGELMVVGDRVVAIGEANGLWIFTAGSLTPDPDPTP